MAEDKISSLIASGTVNLEEIIDTNAVFGKPIVTASGTQIIPFSKVTVGNLSGGGEYGDEKTVKLAEKMPFAGGNGAVVSMKPLGFLVDDGKSCRILRVADDAMDNLIERASEILKSITEK
ncbi:MAG: sporulation protein YtfJ [Clostridia bacterium]|nr:sporulation protein YtfJ [Clostridia bacterium]